MNVNRRQFLSGCLATAATGCAVGAAAGGCKGRDAAGIDPDLSVLVSDVHVPQPWSEQKYRTGREYPWIVGQIRRFVDEILAMRPRPAHVFGFGDMSIAFSEEREYEIAETLFRPLADAGIELVLTVGNHDLREPFMKHLGKWAGKTPVPGRVASVTSLPHFDLVLLDSLKEPKPEDRGKYDALTGCDLGREQRKWLEDFLAAAKRPVILGAHHSAKQAGVDNLVVRSPNVFGYIHGHHHKWDRSYLSWGYSHKTVVRSQGLPSFGIDRDVGYALLRSFPDRAELEYVARDYYFPEMFAKAERPPLWDDIVRDNTGRRVAFPFAK